MMDNKLVSIVIPVYNVEKYLEECLNSVLSQTYHNIEAICVDDASTDGSLAILEKYAGMDERIHIVRNEKNGGLSFARNAGFSKVRGKYTYYLDSDDYLEQDAIEKLYGYAEKENADCIFFNSKILLDADAVHKSSILSFGLKDIEKKIYDGPALFKILDDNNVYSNSVCRQFWNTDFLIQNKLVFENELSISEDGVFSIKAILSGQRMMIVDESYHIYRRRAGSITTNTGPLSVIMGFKSYCYLLDFWYSHQFTDDINCILRNQLNATLIQVKKLYHRNQSKVSIYDFKEGTERHLFEVLMIQEYEKKLNDIDADVLKEICKYKYVIVYGAYIYAGEVVEKLKRKGIQIDSLAITQMNTREEGIGDIPIHEIKDLCDMKEDAIVVFGVSKNNRADVTAELEKYGFHNYISLD